MIQRPEARPSISPPTTHNSTDMNTPRSVAYGWGVRPTTVQHTNNPQALCVATGIGYYLAKGANEERWKDQHARGLRSNDKLDCGSFYARAELTRTGKEKIALQEAQEAAAAEGAAPTPTGVEGRRRGPKF